MFVFLLNSENDINYDECGKEIPEEFNNLVDITRFIKKKDRRLKRVTQDNRRLRKRLEKLRDQYFDFGEEHGVKLPELVGILFFIFLVQLSPAILKKVMKFCYSV